MESHNERQTIGMFITSVVWKRCCPLDPSEMNVNCQCGMDSQQL